MSFTIAPGLNISEDRLREWTSDFYWPGENVRLDPSVGFASENEAEKAARKAQFGDSILTIRESCIDPAPNGGVLITYVFEGVEGKHPAQAFMDPRGYEHLYGIMIQRDGQPWFIPLDPKKETEAAGPARRVATDMERAARNLFGIDEQNTPEAFLSQFDEEPSSGEFVLMPKGDDTWILAYSPWMSGVSPGELELAERMIAEALEATASPVLHR